MPGEVRRAAEPDRLPVLLADSVRDLADAVDVALDEVASEAVAEAQGALEVDAVAGGQFAEVGAPQRLGAGLEAAGFAVVLDDGQAGAVDTHALAEG